MADATKPITDHVLLDVLGDSPRTRILTVLIDHPDKEFDAEHLAEYAGVNADTVRDHIPALRAWGVVRDEEVIQTNKDSDAVAAFADAEWALTEYLASKEDVGEVDDDMNPIDS
ncbi:MULTISPECIES: ArsR/SmtB family transcription factor [Halorussus]|uniref:ArsR family transcriptional regulator n=2 Tax=Halorussus TaxID=1070314 RepID=A0A8U0HU45_9EURY|nr:MULTISPECIES: helix-turn-helix transcriptional regulator [Halorussus]UPV74585.1 ArsR family transcriptional regulator [Halorussus limi]